MRNDMSGRGIVRAVVKLGGSALADTAHFHAALSAIGAAAAACPLLVVPGGGPFADAVREMDRRLRLSDDAAHWMAVLAMDQSAHLVAEHLTESVVVTSPGEIAGALGAARVPVLAPSRWLQEADPLPHDWDVTSDSIAAWVAGCVGARRLVLIKPPGSGPYQSEGMGATGSDEQARQAAVIGLVDACFPRALPPGIAWVIVPVDQVEALPLALGKAPARASFSANTGR